MKTLQEYILESIDTDDVNEGKIWDAIKNWFSDLFSVSNKKYDRFSTLNDPLLINDYKEHLKYYFDVKKITCHEIKASELKKIISTDLKNNITSETGGFNQFIDEPKERNKSQFYIFTYKDSNINDIVCIIKAKHTDVLVSKYIEIEKLDISDFYSDIVKLNKIISIFRTYVMDNSVNKKTTYEGFYTDKSINNNIYNMLINDCYFKKELVNGKHNIAKLEFNK
jgi:hypothetical protein